MHILIIEATLSGHHTPYLERSALAYIGAGHAVTIALPTGISDLKIFRSRLQQYANISWIEYKPMFELNATGFFALLRREYLIRKVFGDVYKAAHTLGPVAHVFLPYMDYCLYAIGLIGSPFGKTGFSGICMRPSFHLSEYGVIAKNSKINIIKRHLFNRLLNCKTLLKIFSIDELLVANTQLKFPKSSPKIEHLPDPVDDPTNVNVELIRSRFDALKDSKIILVYGVLDERKGLCLLLDSLESANELKDWEVWLIGRQSTSIAEQLESNRWSNLKGNNRIKTRNEYISSELEKEILSACDVVWLVYQGHYSMSGVMVHAGRNNKPTISTRSGLIGWHARNFEVGIAIEPTFNSVVVALTTLNDPYTRKSIGLNGFNKFSGNSWANFTKILNS